MLIINLKAPYHGLLQIKKLVLEERKTYTMTYQKNSKHAVTHPFDNSPRLCAPKSNIISNLEIFRRNGHLSQNSPMSSSVRTVNQLHRLAINLKGPICTSLNDLVLKEEKDCSCNEF